MAIIVHTIVIVSMSVWVVTFSINLMINCFAQHWTEMILFLNVDNFLFFCLIFFFAVQTYANDDWRWNTLYELNKLSDWSACLHFNYRTKNWIWITIKFAIENATIYKMEILFLSCWLYLSIKCTQSLRITTQRFLLLFSFVW